MIFCTLSFNFCPERAFTLMSVRENLLILQYMYRLVYLGFVHQGGRYWLKTDALIIFGVEHKIW